MKKLTLLSALIVATFSAMAQDKVSMADEMRANGKIYVVVAVLLTIFIGIIIYLIRLDRKLTKLEKNHITNFK